MPLWHPEIWKEQLHDAAFYWLVIPGAVILSGLILDRVLALPAITGGMVFTAMALALLTAGSWIITKATRDFEAIGHGTPNPFRPPKVLITSGAYRWCRHPMFLGYDLAALGVVFLFRSWAMLCISLPLMLAWQLRFLQKEEETLSRRFREGYDGYRRQVPLLLPWPRPKAPNHPEE
ncbi:MAG TPA: isoprenylcysteine carboxylmethyltransferase family protein [Desulfurivibrionaceae bacterium]|nr:isoprenylcysteine carboxylmethyltransferase family protein [Desulfurivibrionaceae bacterium]